MNSLLLICSFQALFLSVLVFFKKRKNYSDKILAAWLLIIAIHMLIEYLQFYNYDNGYPYPWLIGIDVTFSMLHPILVFIYILSYTRMASNRWSYLWHFLPFVLINLLLAKPFFLQSASEKIAEYNSAMSGHGYINPTLENYTYVIMSVGVGYFVAGLVYIRKHKKNLRQQLSTVKGFDLKWLNILLMVMGGVFLTAVLLEIFTNTLQFVSPEAGSAIVFVLLAIGIFYIGIHGILQTDYFSGYNPNITKSGSKLNRAHRTKLASERSEKNMTDKMALQYDQLVKFIDSEKPFLETDLNLSKLAEMVDMKPHFLSALINQMSDKNFFDFVNSFRILEFKKQVQDPANHQYTLISIAYSCGFNSKSTFNRAFKNSTGQTPSEYYQDAIAHFTL